MWWLRKSWWSSMYLFIDTHTTDGFSLAELDGKKWQTKIVAGKYKQSEQLLPAIQKFVDLKKLRGVAVVSGPGSFSGLRLGIMVANTLGWVKNIPLTGLELKEGELWLDWCARAYQKLLKTKSGRLVAPMYGREPNITMKRGT